MKTTISSKRSYQKPDIADAQFVVDLISATTVTPELLKAAELRANRAKKARSNGLASRFALKTA
ncbi:MAG: hypothetical protein KGL39_28035 [Patescibacteria group bacterium]|nr:hypothetical protein [Patescibacteria group bacterium]